MDHLEIISDTDSEIDDPTYIPSDEESSSSEYDDYFCYYCECNLDYEDNEFYDSEADRFYCQSCWRNIHEN